MCYFLQYIHYVCQHPAAGAFVYQECETRCCLERQNQGELLKESRYPWLWDRGYVDIFRVFLAGRCKLCRKEHGESIDPYSQEHCLLYQSQAWLLDKACWHVPSLTLAGLAFSEIEWDKSSSESSHPISNSADQARFSNLDSPGDLNGEHDANKTEPCPGEALSSDEQFDNSWPGGSAPGGTSGASSGRLGQPTLLLNTSLPAPKRQIRRVSFALSPRSQQQPTQMDGSFGMLTPSLHRDVTTISGFPLQERLRRRQSSVETIHIRRRGRLASTDALKSLVPTPLRQVLHKQDEEMIHIPRSGRLRSVDAPTCLIPAPLHIELKGSEQARPGNPTGASSQERNRNEALQILESNGLPVQKCRRGAMISDVQNMPATVSNVAEPKPRPLSELKQMTHQSQPQSEAKDTPFLSNPASRRVPVIRIAPPTQATTRHTQLSPPSLPSPAPALAKQQSIPTIDTSANRDADLPVSSLLKAPLTDPFAILRSRPAPQHFLSSSKVETSAHNERRQGVKKDKGKDNEEEDQDKDRGKDDRETPQSHGRAPHTQITKPSPPMTLTSTEQNTSSLTSTAKKGWHNLEVWIKDHLKECSVIWMFVIVVFISLFN